MKSNAVLVLAVVAMIMVIFATVDAVSMESNPVGPSQDLSVAPLQSTSSWHNRSADKPLLYGYSYDYTFTHIDLVAPGEAWAAAGGAILHLENGVWEIDEEFRVPHPGVRALSMVSSTVGWASEGRSYESDGQGGFAHGHGRLLSYTGSTWTPVTSPVSGTVVGISMITADDGWAVTQDGEFARYSSGVWQEVASPTTESLSAINMATTDSGWAVGSNGTIVQYSNGSWQLDSSPTSEHLAGVHARTPQDVWAVGTSNVLHYNGSAWQIAHSVGGYDVFMVSADEGWVAGNQLLYYQNGAWTAYEVPQPSWPTGGQAVPTSIEMLSSDSGWAVGTSGLLLQYTTDPAGLLSDEVQAFLPNTRRGW